jgi:hypothetical protein
MFHRWLVLIVVGCAVFGAACQKDSGDAGASMEKQAEQAAGVVKDMAAETEEAAVKEKIAAMNPEDLMSDAGKALKENAEKLTGEIATLQKKLEGMAG